MEKDKKDSIVHFRLDDDTHERMLEVSKKTGLSFSALTRLLLEQFMAHLKKTGGKIVMPPEFVEYDVHPKHHQKVAESPAEYRTLKKE